MLLVKVKCLKTVPGEPVPCEVTAFPHLPELPLDRGNCLTSLIIQKRERYSLVIRDSPCKYLHAPLLNPSKVSVGVQTHGHLLMLSDLFSGARDDHGADHLWQGHPCHLLPCYPCALPAHDMCLETKCGSESGCSWQPPDRLSQRLVCV